jgi:hypothetical protein
MRRVMDKKGLSDIVTTLLIVLLGLAAVVLIWQVGIKPILNKGTAQIGVTQACLDLGLEAVSCNVNDTAHNATVLYKRGTQEITQTVSKINLLFIYGDGTTKTFVSTIIPTILQTVPFTTKSVWVTGGLLPVRVSAIATLTNTDGTEASCSADAAATVTSRVKRVN